MVRSRRGIAEMAAVVTGGLPPSELKPCVGDGRVGGIQAYSRYCSERGCRYVFVSVVPIRTPPRCPKHKKEVDAQKP